MYIEPAILSAASALTGAFMGGGASLVAALYTQRCQNRIQRATREVTKRETVYAEFIMNASKSLLNAYLYDEISWTASNNHSSASQTECGSSRQRR
jgi:hypothetical protein